MVSKLSVCLGVAYTVPGPKQVHSKWQLSEQSSHILFLEMPEKRHVHCLPVLHQPVAFLILHTCVPSTSVSYICSSPLTVRYLRTRHGVQFINISPESRTGLMPLADPSNLMPLSFWVSVTVSGWPKETVQEMLHSRMRAFVHTVPLCGEHPSYTFA